METRKTWINPETGKQVGPYDYIPAKRKTIVHCGGSSEISVPGVIEIIDYNAETLIAEFTNGNRKKMTFTEAGLIEIEKPIVYPPALPI